MPRAKHNRKTLFRAALVIAGLTAEQWAAQEGLTAGHVSQVLAGKRESARLVEKIDAFVQEHLKHSVALAS
ncbi:MAG: hypothetical protein JWL61_5016 [Gemmatimonadetes bacterium]|nr:hypothetical protein [Gemmatimonadota bacterium]